MPSHYSRCTTLVLISKKNENYKNKCKLDVLVKVDGDAPDGMLAAQSPMRIFMLRL